MSADRPATVPESINVRGYDLPAGMTPACFEGLCDLFNEKAHYDCQFECEEMAIRAFGVFRAFQE